MICYFKLGHQPHISIAELKAVFKLESIEHEIIKVIKDEAIVDIKSDFHFQTMIKRLGGIVFFGELLGKGDKQKIIFDFLKEKKGKINFSVKGGQAEKVSLNVKKKLKAEGYSCRYIKFNNIATILHNDLVRSQTDFTLFEDMVFVTGAIQPIEDYTKRDYERPEIDSRSGMLPPKLARIMINLSGIKNDKVLLDPFCGSGTVLLEAMDLGFTKIIGSDISEKAVLASLENLKWLEGELNLKKVNFKVIKQNVISLASQLGKDSADVIVSEPYLGKPMVGRENIYQIQEQILELKKLYIEAFRNFYRILKTGGKIIFIIPRFKFKDEWFEIDCLAEIKKIGFSQLKFEEENKDYLLYWRDGQHVGREIWHFEK